jgi:hypothetical protein
MFLPARLLLAALLLAGQFAQAFAGDVSGRFTALQKAAQERHFGIIGLQILVVPDAGGALANQFTVASLKGGNDSLASWRIAQLLLEASPIQLAPICEDDALGAATLERALAKVRGKTLAPHQLVFVGAKEYEASLTALAADMGLKLVYVPYPAP